MTGACPKCGWQPVSGVHCPRCGVDGVRYLAELRTASGTVPLDLRLPGPSARPISSSPAGFWIRVAALLIDRSLVVGALMAAWMAGSVLVGTSLPFVNDFPRLMRAWLYAFALVGAALAGLYPVVFHWMWGQTLGKMAVEIRVVAMDGGPLSLGRALVRQLGSWLSDALFCVGYIIAGLRRDKRALHDLIAGTRVERLS